jgi:hypothetical protein
MPTLRGQKMYGVLYLGDPDQCFACLRLDDEASRTLDWNGRSSLAASTDEDSFVTGTPRSRSCRRSSALSLRT